MADTDNLDVEETEQMNDDGIDAEEEHRYSEFEDLRNRLETIANTVDDMFSVVRTFASLLENKTSSDAIDAMNGDDGNGSDDEEIYEMNPDFDELDLEL